MFTLNEQLLLAATVPPVRLKLLAPVVGEPPQVFTMFGGFATARPNGKLSPTLMPLRDAVTLGFVIVRVTVVTPPSGTLGPPKARLTDVGPTTVRVALTVLPAPALLDVTPTLLFLTPKVAPVTFTANVHCAPAARPAPERLTLEEPAVALTVPPPQAPVSPFGDAITTPVGRVPVNAIPFNVELMLGLWTLKLSALLVPTVIELGLKDCAITGGLITVMLAEAVLPVPPSVELTLPVTLFCTPSTTPITFTENVQLVLTVAPDRLMVFDPAAAVIVPPPHEPLSPLGVATAKPAGKTSVKANPCVATGFGLVIVKLRLATVPPVGIVDAPKLLLMDAGNRMAMLAVAVALSAVASAWPEPAVFPAVNVAVAVPLL